MDSNHRYPEDKLPLETGFCRLRDGEQIADRAEQPAADRVVPSVG
jgi:hypothetical protein